MAIFTRLLIQRCKTNIKYNFKIKSIKNALLLMKKILTILFSVIILFINSKVKAQETTDPIRSYLSLIDGLSRPISNFGSYNYYNNKAGFAKPNNVLGFDGCVYLYKNLGLGYSLTYQDQGELTQNDVNLLSTAYAADFVKPRVEVTSNNRYTNINFMAGPQYSYVYKSFTLDVRGTIGFFKNISTPTTDIDLNPYTSNTTNPLLIMHQLSTTAFAFSYGASAAVRWAFSDNWDLGIKTGYINSDGPTIKNTNNANTVGRFVTKLPMTMIQTTLGISLKF